MLPQVGKYQLLERIGSGGMAEIHLARVVGAKGFAKLVVVKRLLPSLAEEKDYVAQFIDEARLAATFSHANIVSTFDFGEADGAFYIAMEFVEGKNLRRLQDVLEALGKRLSEPMSAHIVAELCRGLEHAHSRKDANGKPLQVVHRDVSPQNVVVSYDGDVKVLDFGIAKSSAREVHTEAGVVKGKMRYMAPEQITGGEVDARADQFAAGVILFELLFGRREMPDLEGTELAHWTARAEFSKPAGAPRVDPALEAVATRATQSDPDRRFPSCGEMARELARVISHRWPDFAPGDLAAMLASEFADDIVQEREWITAILAITESQSSPIAAPPSLAILSERPTTAIPRPDDVFTLAEKPKTPAEIAAAARARPRRPALVAGLSIVAVAAVVAAGAFGFRAHAAHMRAQALASASATVDAMCAKRDEGGALAWLTAAITANPDLAPLAAREPALEAASMTRDALNHKIKETVERVMWDEARKYPDNPDVPFVEAVIAYGSETPSVSAGLYGDALARGHAKTPGMFVAVREGFGVELPETYDGKSLQDTAREQFDAERRVWASTAIHSKNIAETLNAMVILEELHDPRATSRPFAAVLHRIAGGNRSPEDLERATDAKDAEEALAACTVLEHMDKQTDATWAIRTGLKKKWNLEL